MTDFEEINVNFHEITAPYNESSVLKENYLKSFENLFKNSSQIFNLLSLNMSNNNSNSFDQITKILESGKMSFKEMKRNL